MKIIKLKEDILRYYDKPLSIEYTSFVFKKRETDYAEVIETEKSTLYFDEIFDPNTITLIPYMMSTGLDIPYPTVINSLFIIKKITIKYESVFVIKLDCVYDISFESLITTSKDHIDEILYIIARSLDLMNKSFAYLTSKKMRDSYEINYDKFINMDLNFSLPIDSRMNFVENLKYKVYENSRSVIGKDNRFWLEFEVYIKDTKLIYLYHLLLNGDKFQCKNMILQFRSNYHSGYSPSIPRMEVTDNKIIDKKSRNIFKYYDDEKCNIFNFYKYK